MFARHHAVAGAPVRSDARAALAREPQPRPQQPSAAAARFAHLNVRVVDGMVDVASLLNDHPVAEQPHKPGPSPRPGGEPPNALGVPSNAFLFVADDDLARGPVSDARRPPPTGVLVCKQCGEWNADASAFGQHKARRVCTKEPKRCRWPGCPKRFKHSHQLLYHVRVHTREKPYACRQCASAFAQPGDLDRHVRTHTGEKPFVCDQCGDAFTVSTALRRHKRTHTGERPHACTHPDCGRTFIQKFDCDRHILTHSARPPFVCDHPRCGKQFLCHGDLARHALGAHAAPPQSSSLAAHHDRPVP